MSRAKRFGSSIGFSKRPLKLRDFGFWLSLVLVLVLVLVLNEMVLVLVLEDTASSTSTANAEYEYEYEKARETWTGAPSGSDSATSLAYISENGYPLRIINEHRCADRFESAKVRRPLVSANKNIFASTVIGSGCSYNHRDTTSTHSIGNRGCHDQQTS